MIEGKNPIWSRNLELEVKTVLWQPFLQEKMEFCLAKSDYNEELLMDFGILKEKMKGLVIQWEMEGWKMVGFERV